MDRTLRQVNSLSVAGSAGYLRPVPEPLFVGLELDSKFVVTDAKHTITVALDRLRHQRLHFLRHHANVGAVAPVVAEPIIAKTVRQVSKQSDIVFDADVGSPAPSTAASATKTAARETASAADATPATTCGGKGSAAVSAGELLIPARAF